MGQEKNVKLAIDDIQPGMKLGQVVLERGSQLALMEGMMLTESLIARLKSRGITHLIIAMELIDNQVTKANRNFHKAYDELVPAVKKSFDSMRFAKEFSMVQMKEAAETSIAAMVDSVGVMSHLLMVRRQDDYTFHHSLNVAVISGVLGRWLGYSGENLTNLILSGLLHDVGKSQIPLEILNKPGRLLDDEMAIMKMHTLYGYDLTKNIPGIAKAVLAGIVQHHERLDGSGYPFGVHADKIEPFGRIIAVADIYDALTSDRVYHKKATPFAVAEVLVEEMFGTLDPMVCSVFLNNVRDYFLGNRVLLNTGERAEVVFLGQFLGARPIVKTEEEEFIDLERRKEIGIIKLIKA